MDLELILVDKINQSDTRFLAWCFSFFAAAFPIYFFPLSWYDTGIKIKEGDPMYHFKWVTLHVSDMERSLRFYVDLMGMKVSEHILNDKMEINMLVTENGVNIELIRLNDEIIVGPGRGVSVGLIVPNAAALTAKLKEEGIEVKGPFSPNPYLTFYFAVDPDGYMIQLI